MKYSYILSLTSALDGGGCSAPRIGRFTPEKETRYVLYRRLVEPKVWSGRVRKISLSPRFDTRTVQPGCGGSDGYIIAAAYEGKIKLLTLMYICSPTRYTKCFNEWVYSSRMLARHVSDLTGPSSGPFYKLYFQALVCCNTRITTYQSLRIQLISL